MLKFCWAGLMFSSILEWRLCTILISTVSSNKQQHRTKLLYVYIYINSIYIYNTNKSIYIYLHILKAGKMPVFFLKTALKSQNISFLLNKKNHQNLPRPCLRSKALNAWFTISTVSSKDLRRSKPWFSGGVLGRRGSVGKHAGTRNKKVDVSFNRSGKFGGI